MTFRKTPIHVLAPLVFLVGACAARVDTEHSDYDEFGDRRDRYQVETTFISRDNAKLERAQSLARDGNYKEAIALLERMHAQSDLDPELRQDVLLSLGAMHGAWRNALKDYEKGLVYLRELLAEYPDTAHRQRATEMIAAYEKALRNR